MPRLNTPEELTDFRQEIVSKRDPNKPCISICAGAGCIASGADEVIEAFKTEIENQGLTATVDRSFLPMLSTNTHLKIKHWEIMVKMVGSILM